MYYKVVINPYRGGDDIGYVNNIIEKDYNLDISKYMYNRLLNYNIDVSLIRDKDITIDDNTRINMIKYLYGTSDRVIVITNALTRGKSGVEIVYSVRNDNKLVKNIAKEIDNINIIFNKYYTRRLPIDISLDYNSIIRETNNNISIIIYYGNVDNNYDINYLINKKYELVDAVIKGLCNYINRRYVSNNS